MFTVLYGKSGASNNICVHEWLHVHKDLFTLIQMFTMTIHGLFAVFPSSSFSAACLFFCEYTGHVLFIVTVFL